MTTQQHTPTPYDTKPTAGEHQHLIWDQSGKTIALVYTDATDAAFIVRACNAHDALVVALEEWHRLDNIVGLNESVRKKMKQHARDLTREALKLARGES